MESPNPGPAAQAVARRPEPTATHRRPNRTSLARSGALTTTILLVAAALAGCDGSTFLTDGAEAGTALAAGAPLASHGAHGPARALTAAQNRELALLRRVTAPYHDLAVADDAGFEVLVAHPVTGAECLSDPEAGGMGYHYLNPEHVGPEVKVDEPQVIMYEDGPDGRKHMVGVEYIIPFDIRPDDAAPPELFGQAFMRNYTFNVWALHVWVWKNNPSGMFADWNPRVSCG
jgi:hypothetical protein